ncbi:MAG: OFA family MFS transporter [Acidobacteriia bacterium]|nr:OFA family MFS transporter [Terriglobia bacterium]
MSLAGAIGRRHVIVVVCTLLQLCLGTVYAWSFFQSLLVSQLGWTYIQTAYAFSITIFSLGIAAAWAGRALPRFGPRKLATLGSAMFAAGYVAAGTALEIESMALFYLGYGCVGGAGIGLGYVTPVATAAKWFPERKGLVTGIVIMGFGLGASLLSKGLAPYLVTLTDGDLALVFTGLGIIFGCILIPSSLLLTDPPKKQEPPVPAKAIATDAGQSSDSDSIAASLYSSKFLIMWLVFFFNISAGISVISVQSQLFQDVWRLGEPLAEPEALAQYGATLIAVSSLFNGVGRLFWASLSDRFGRTRVFRILLASQMVVFGVLMSERDPWIFAALVCYILLCFGGGFATMPSFVSDVFGSKRMSAIYGTILTAWSAAGIFGPLYMGYLRDQYPDRFVIYCFLVGVLILGMGYVFSYLLNDERIRTHPPTLEGTLRQFGIPRLRKP